MFVDKATITVSGGRGGDGAVSFHREKYVAAGGPNGGDGGRGGNVVIAVDDNMSTLMDFRYKRKYKAENGAPGGQRLRSGKYGEDIIIKVPRGTLIRDVESGGIIKDMSGSDSFILARGGGGGRGNKYFATPTRQVPRFAKPGRDGALRKVTLELKLLADVGLVGFPNVGKSTLLSVVSNSHPKIANYHFTTLFPNLGVVYVREGTSFVMADIPGIIEGASDGAGLGHDFLRHIERCRLILHLVDISGSEGRDPLEDFRAINSELSLHNPELASRPQIVVANKCDLLGDDRSALENLRKEAQALGYSFFEISAAARLGVHELIDSTAGHLAALPPIIEFEPDYVEPELIPATPDDLVIEDNDGIWTIEGEWIERLLASVNFSDYESRMYFDRILHEYGVFERLENLGIREGDTVSIYELEFDYQP